MAGGNKKSSYYDTFNDDSSVQNTEQPLKTQKPSGNFGAEIINHTKKSALLENREGYANDDTVFVELNTYLSNSQLLLTEMDFSVKQGKKNLNTKLPETYGVRSIFNKYNGVLIGGQNFEISETGDILSRTNDFSPWRIRNNIPLLDSRLQRNKMRQIGKCTIKNLIQESKNGGLLGNETYSYSDFMYCKYLGRLPNNYLITLRRFPTPVEDYISNPGIISLNANKDNAKTSSSDDGKKDSTAFLQNGHPPCLGEMVTWLGTPGNDMSNILKYEYKMPFQQKESKWETPETGDMSTGVKSGKIIPNLAAMFDDNYRAHVSEGRAPVPFGNYINSFLASAGQRGGMLGKAAAGFFTVDENPYSLADLQRRRDANKTYGPVDAIKSVYMRDGDAGLQFSQSFTLTFEYELRAYAGINTKQAMLDLISNILCVTYSPGDFWGGGYYGGGIHQSNAFTNSKLFARHKNWSEFASNFDQGLANVIKTKVKQSPGLRDFIQDPIKFMRSMGDNLKKSFVSGGSNLFSMLLGGMQNKWGRPQKMWANSLLSDAPVGLWHVTIGNPFHPIMSLGNLILKNTTIEHTGPLGLDDFPTGLKVTCEFDRGKPRDLRAIERMYMQGNDRIYTPLSETIAQKYITSTLIKSKEQATKKKAFLDNIFTEEEKTQMSDACEYVKTYGKNYLKNMMDKGVEKAKKTGENIIMETRESTEKIKNTTNQTVNDIKEAISNYRDRYFNGASESSIIFTSRAADRGQPNPKKPKPKQ